jgi:hypothetical protein
VVHCRSGFRDRAGFRSVYLYRSLDASDRQAAKGGKRGEENGSWHRKETPTPLLVDHVNGSGRTPGAREPIQSVARPSQTWRGRSPKHALRTGNPGRARLNDPLRKKAARNINIPHLLRGLSRSGPCRARNSDHFRLASVSGVRVAPLHLTAPSPSMERSILPRSPRRGCMVRRLNVCA